jgi:TorA maturation chaperone TorD
MSPDDEQITALVAGVQMLSELFWGPNLERCHDILAGAYFQPFTTLESVLKFNPPDVLQKIESYLKKFPDADSLFQNLEPDYVRLFISHRDGIAAPLYESCYVGVEPGETGSLMGEPALGMKRCFEAKGLSIDTRVNEPPDHLAIELEYLYFLLEKGRSDDDRELIGEASSFSSDIMLPWVTRLQKRLAVVETEGSFYLLITTLLCAIVQFIGRESNT